MDVSRIFRGVLLTVALAYSTNNSIFATISNPCPGSRSSMCGDCTLDGNLTVTGTIFPDIILDTGQPGALIIGTSDATTLSFIVDNQNSMVLDASSVSLEQKILRVNDIAPASGSAVCFGGNVSVGNQILLVNNIRPASVYDCTLIDGQGTITFAGSLVADNHLSVQNLQAGTFNADTLSVANACIAEALGVQSVLLVNKIDPYSTSSCFVANSAGTTVFKGNVAITKTLSTQTIDAYDRVTISPGATPTALLIVQGGELLSAGDLLVSAGDVVLPAATPTQGQVLLGDGDTTINVILYETGTRNVFLGNGSVKTNVTGSSNISIGSGANSQLTSANNTIALGPYTSALGTDSIAIGQRANAAVASGIALGSTGGLGGPSVTSTGGVAIGSGDTTSVGARASNLSVLALGSQGATASGSHALAIGSSATASGASSIALGESLTVATAPQASNTGAVAIGSTNIAANGARTTGIASVVIGSANPVGNIRAGATSDQNRGVVLGLGMSSRAAQGVLINSISSSVGVPVNSAPNSIGIGSSNGTNLGSWPITNNSIAISGADPVLGAPSFVQTRQIAIGAGTGGANISICIGAETSGNSAASVTAIGNKSRGSGDAFVSVGPTDGVTNASNAGATQGVALGTGANLSVASSIVLGNASSSAVRVGIGTSVPVARLDIYGFPGDVPVLELDAGPYSSPVTWINQATSGAAGTPLHYNASNQIFGFTSSRRYKENIRPITTESEVLYRLQPVLYSAHPCCSPTFTQVTVDDEYGCHITWIGESCNQMLDRVENIPGLIAEDVYGLAPDLVICDCSHRPVNIAYNALHSLLVHEVQEHKNMIDEQSSVLEGLELSLHNDLDQTNKLIAFVHALRTP